MFCLSFCTVKLPKQIKYLFTEIYVYTKRDLQKNMPTLCSFLQIMQIMYSAHLQSYSNVHIIHADI